MALELHGVLCALLTPLTADGAQIDEAGLRELVEGTIQAGIHGLIPCGGTGEFASLSTKERKRVAEVVVDQARGRVPVVPHTGSTRTAVAIELSRHAESLGAAGVMVIPPYCEPMSLDEVYRYYQDISSAIDIPIMVYNSPGCTGMNLTASFVARMGREIERVKYVKDSSGNLSQVYELLYQHEKDVTVFNGWDTDAFTGLLLGLKGLVWGAANMMPKQCADLFNLMEAGRVDEGRALWDRMLPAIRFIVTEGYNASIKAGANLMGFHVGPPRLPFLPLCAEKQEQLKRLLIDAGMLKEAEPA